MREKLRFLGLDVHAETIAVALAEPDGEVRSLGTIANREESIRKLIRKLGASEHLRACYEAGPTGLRTLLAADAAGGQVRCSGAGSGSEEARGPGQDRPAGCAEAGAESPLRWT